VDISQMALDLHSSATTPSFSWFAADDYYDGEAAGNGTPGSIRVQDAWLKQTIQPIFDSPAWKTQRSLLILTWDESLTPSNNQIATVLVDSQGLVNRGYVSGAYYNHYNVGRTIEDALGVAPFTANDRYAAPINDAFTPVTTPAQPGLSASAVSVPAGSAMSFHYSTVASKFSAKNWIGLYPIGVTPGKQASLAWKYAPEMTASQDFSTSGLAPGQYAAWYCYNDGYSVLAGPVPFTLTSP